MQEKLIDPSSAAAFKAQKCISVKAKIPESAEYRYYYKTHSHMA